MGPAPTMIAAGSLRVAKKPRRYAAGLEGGNLCVLQLAREHISIVDTRAAPDQITIDGDLNITVATETRSSIVLLQYRRHGVNLVFHWLVPALPIAGAGFLCGESTGGRGCHENSDCALCRDSGAWLRCAG